MKKCEVCPDTFGECDRACRPWVCAHIRDGTDHQKRHATAVALAHRCPPPTSPPQVIGMGGQRLPGSTEPPAVLSPSPVESTTVNLFVMLGRILACPHRTPATTCKCSGYCAKGRGRIQADGRSLVESGDCEACPDLPEAP